MPARTTRLDLDKPLTEKQRSEALARIRAKCIDINGCWEWHGFKNPLGYGDLSFQHQKWRVHRLVWVLTKGAIPDGHYVCHSCDNRACCNPEHLWLGTQDDNMKDCAKKKRIYWASKTHCPRGHEYNAENTLITFWRNSYKRQCKVCHRIKQRMAAGWTLEQATTLPVTPHGYQPVGGNFKRRRSHVGSAPEDGK